MEGNVIKSFLVGLGFGVDDASLAKFNKAIAQASAKVAALYGGIQIAAAGIFASVAHMSSGFEEMGYQLRLVAPAINKMLILRQAMISAYQAAGINITKAVQQSILFNYSLAKTKFALEAVYKSVGIKFLPLLTKQMDIFRAKIFANMPKIQAQLTSLVNFIFRAFDATVQLGGRIWDGLQKIYELFKKLDEVTGGWSTKILGFIAIWKIFNLGFLATPFGMIIAGITAIIALYDDFKVWEEGGKAFFNWGSDTTKMIIGLTSVLAAFAAAWGVAALAVNGYALAAKAATAIQIAFDVALNANPIGLFIIGLTALVGILTALDAKWNTFGGHITGFFTNIGAKILDFAAGSSSKVADVMGGASAGVNTANAINPQPLISNHGGSSQKVNQETNIIVQGSADAGAVGKTVANEQGKVNFDMVRNLKGAMR